MNCFSRFTEARLIAMNILFLSLGNYKSLNDGGLYSDLIRNFINDGHCIYVVSPAERRTREKTKIIREGKCIFLRVKTLNIQKTNVIEKGLSTILLPRQFLKGIKRFLKGIKFDLILYPTPPITLCKIVKKIKSITGAKTYLMLKDIFPQNAIDLGILKKKGFKGILFKFFRRQETKLYEISDKIGCMSEANVNYLLANNHISQSKVEIFRNCINPNPLTLTDDEKKNIIEKYNLPTGKKIFVYGGNLGKPQDINFILEAIYKCNEFSDAFFLIVGNGTDAYKIRDYCKNPQNRNVKYLESIPRADYQKLLNVCDIGLIFLDYRFTIPNFPSRLLSYLEAGIPVLACTDESTDLRTTIIDNKLGWWVPSNNSNVFKDTIKLILNDKTNYRVRALTFLENNFNCKNEYKKILEVLEYGKL